MRAQRDCRFRRAGAPSRACLLAGLCVLAATRAAFAQGDGSQSIHWAYAAFFGTGRYSVDGAQEVEALRLELRRRLREARLEDSQRNVGITWRLPVALSRHEPDDPALTGGLVDSVSAISVVPGLEFTIPLGERWTIKPLANVGYGKTFDGDSSAWIYWLGVRSQLALDAERFDWALVGSLLIAGYSSDAESERTLPLTVGLEFRKLLPERRIGGDPVFLNWHIAHTSYLDEPVFGRLTSSDRVLDLDDEWELGIAFSKGDKRLRFLKLAWDRVGIAYKVSSNGDFEGLRLNFRSLFDR